MKIDFLERIQDSRDCQAIANTKEHDMLDCLDAPSLACFRCAFVIAKTSGWETVLITGPNGVGKTGYAKLIWNENPAFKKKNAKPLNVNCAAFPGNLIESELFGYVNGAFTGASKNGHLGKIKTAAEKNGCIFLDEVGDLPLVAQASLLRFFQDHEIQVVGAAEPEEIKEDLKVICATNKNLEEEIRKGNFREDLYNRINKYKVEVPPLYLRPNDFAINAQHFLDKFISRQAEQDGRENWAKMLKLDSSFDTDNRKSGYRWPGNFRELDNRLNQALIRVIVEEKNVIKFADLFAEDDAPAEPAALLSLEKFGFPTGAPLRKFDLEKQIGRLEEEYIAMAMKQCSCNKTNAAQLLGFSSFQKMDRRLTKK
jgi:transcriptional regulator with PAS, ATPase and Fis domain